MPVFTADQLDPLAQADDALALEAAAAYLEGIIRQVLSVVAPREFVSGRGGSRAVATIPATPGAPPRVVSGRMIGAVHRQQVHDFAWDVGVFGVPYAGRHEVTNHPWLSIALERALPVLQRMVPGITADIVIS